MYVGLHVSKKKLQFSTTIYLTLTHINIQIYIIIPFQSPFMLYGIFF